MTPEHTAGMPATADRSPIRVERLSESYRFDDELAAVLTEFQYSDDGITLTSNEERPVPAVSADVCTPGLASVFGAGASLVFVTYDGRGHRMVNPIERTLIAALAAVVDGGLVDSPSRPDETTVWPSLGVVTPHNAQRGALETALPAGVTANTVEKYQGGERDIIAVSATVADPEFARREDEFILDANRILVAISRSRVLTIVVCSTALFEVAPADSECLEDGPVWARLFTQAVGRTAEPAWAGPLGEFVGEERTEYADMPVQVYPSTIDTSGGEQ